MTAISYTDLLRYFTATKRRTACSSCGTDGKWLFHAAEHNDTDLDPPMMVFSLPNLADSTRPLSVHIVECEQCAHMEFVRLDRVLAWLKEANKEGQSE